MLHDPFAFPYQPAVFYGGDFPLTNVRKTNLKKLQFLFSVSNPLSINYVHRHEVISQKIQKKKYVYIDLYDATNTLCLIYVLLRFQGLIPPPGTSAKRPIIPPLQPNLADGQSDAKASTEASVSTPQPGPSQGDTGKPTPAPPLPPNTQSPIPLNEFGLPAQVLPLGRFDPAYDGFTQVGPFAYTYPSLRFYDPYDPFTLGHYANLPPLYRPLPNYLGPVALPQATVRKDQVPASTPEPAGSEQSASAQSPPPEPNDLNVLNYASKDPAIPNVPPPPLPQGGLKPDNAE